MPSATTWHPRAVGEHVLRARLSRWVRPHLTGTVTYLDEEAVVTIGEHLVGSGASPSTL